MTRAGHEVRGYPALVDDGQPGGEAPSSVSVRVLATEAEQSAAMRVGDPAAADARGPLAGGTPRRRARQQRQAGLGLAPHRTTEALLDDAYAAAVDAIVSQHGDQAWDRAGFERLVEAVRRDGESRTRDVVIAARRRAAAGTRGDASALRSRRAGPAARPVRPEGAVGAAVPDGFVADAGVEALRHYPRYLTAMATRLDKLARDPRRDAVLMGTVRRSSRRTSTASPRSPTGLPEGEALRAVRWMVEELRVSLWAQQLTTAYPISVHRIEKALRDL